MNQENKKTLILGASPNPDRYSYKAAQRLLAKGHDIELFAKRPAELFGHTIKTDLEKLDKDIHTVTMYLSPVHQQEYKDFLYKLKPKRIIFNPGAENPELEKQLEMKGIETMEACTLVLLSTGQF